MSAEPFRRLVKLVGRAFYDDVIPHKGTNPNQNTKNNNNNKSDNKGIAVVILDALTRRQWVKEEELAKSLKLHPKQLRRALRVLEDGYLVMKEDRKETVKGAKAYNAAVAATMDGQTMENEKTKILLHSYWCLDYAQVCDVVRYRMLRAKKKLKEQLEDKNAVQEYVCPDAACGRRYSALDASRLISLTDMNFHCEKCDAELVAENDKLAPKEMVEGDSEESSRRRRREKLKEMLERMEVQLKPLADQLVKLKDIRPPDYGTFVQWQERALLQARAAGEGTDKGANDRPGVPMPFLGETKVEVALADTESREAKKEDAGTAMKVLPPWMIRQGMSLTAQQRGEAKKEEDGFADEKPKFAAKFEEKDVKPESAETQLQEEYAKAFYAAYLQQKVADEPHENGVASEEERQIGVKAKREPDEDGIVWEEEDEAAAAAESRQEVTPADEPAAASDDDDIDWE